MIVIEYNTASKALDAIANKLMDANIGHRLVQSDRVKEMMVEDGDKTYIGTNQVETFIANFIKEVEGWGRCACEG